MTSSDENYIAVDENSPVDEIRTPIYSNSTADEKSISSLSESWTSELSTLMAPKDILIRKLEEQNEELKQDKNELKLEKAELKLENIGLQEINKTLSRQLLEMQERNIAELYKLNEGMNKNMGARFEAQIIEKDMVNANEMLKRSVMQVDVFQAQLLEANKKIESLKEKIFERELQIGKEKEVEKERKIAELEDQLQKLSFKPNDKNFGREGNIAKNNIKSKIYAFDWNHQNSKKIARFNDETNNWQNIELLHEAHPEREWFALTNIGANVFTTGGCISDKRIKDCHVINLTPGEGNAVKSFYDLNIARAYHCALSSGTNICVFGGRDSNFNALSSIESSDGIGSWTKTGVLCDKRVGATGAVVDGIAYVIGGIDGQNYRNSVGRFDAREGNKCKQVKNMKESRFWAASAEHKGLIYVTGGCNEKNTVEIYDPRSDQWTYGPKMNSNRYYHALISDGNRLLAIGGTGSNNMMEELIDEKWNILHSKSPFNHLQAVTF